MPSQKRGISFADPSSRPESVSFASAMPSSSNLTRTTPSQSRRRHAPPPSSAAPAKSCMKKLKTHTESTSPSSLTKPSVMLPTTAAPSQGATEALSIPTTGPPCFTVRSHLPSLSTCISRVRSTATWASSCLPWGSAVDTQDTAPRSWWSAITGYETAPSFASVSAWLGGSGVSSSSTVPAHPISAISFTRPSDYSESDAFKAYTSGSSAASESCVTRQNRIRARLHHALRSHNTVDSRVLKQRTWGALCASEAAYRRKEACLFESYVERIAPEIESLLNAASTSVALPWADNSVLNAFKQLKATAPGGDLTAALLQSRCSEWDDSKRNELAQELDWGVHNLRRAVQMTSSYGSPA